MEGVSALIILTIIITALMAVGNVGSKINALRKELSSLRMFLNNIQAGVDEIRRKQDAGQAGYNSDIAVLPQKHQQPEMPSAQTPQAQTEHTADTGEPLARQNTAADQLPPEPPSHINSEMPPPAQESEAVPQSMQAEAGQAAETFSATANLPNASMIPGQRQKTNPTPAKKTNFEQFIGEKLMSIVGITILVLGIFFSVKWAIDRNLISDTGKVLIGIASGTLLIGVAHRLAKNYRTFSSILVGGGIAVLYFSIYEAYQAYHLLSQTIAFILMVLITLLAVVLSIVYDKKELAIIAIVGGFCSPFFVSNGSGDYKTLFSYLLILNIGMFLLANFKQWNIVNIICYVFTLTIFGAWTANKATPAEAGGAFLFSTLFYLVFFGSLTIYNLRHRKAFRQTEIILLLSNSFVYLGFGLYFLNFIRTGQFQGIFSLGLAAFNCTFAYIFYRYKNIDRNFIFLLIGLTLTFLSLTAPLQLDGNYITLFWACELALLYWLGERTGIELIKNTSPLLLVLTLGSLIRDWNQDYYRLPANKLPVIFNKAFITASVVVSSVFFTRKLAGRDKTEKIIWGNLAVKDYHRLLSWLLLLLLYISMFLEVSYQSFAAARTVPFRVLMLCTYHFTFVTVISLLMIRKAYHQQVRISLGILALSMLLYMLLGNSAIARLRDQAMSTGQPGHYFSHYLLVVAVLAGIIVLGRYIKRHYAKDSLVFTGSSWLISTVLVFLISAETTHIWLLSHYSPGSNNAELAGKAYKVAFPIIWAICSLCLMLLGMRYRVKTWRIISLSLFLITTLKLFIYDISNVGQGGKIAAFIILGVVLLVVSFMYQKIKGLFRDDEQTEAQDNATHE